MCCPIQLCQQHSLLRYSPSRCICFVPATPRILPPCRPTMCPTPGRRTTVTATTAHCLTRTLAAMALAAFRRGLTLRPGIRHFCPCCLLSATSERDVGCPAPGSVFGMVPRHPPLAARRLISWEEFTHGKKGTYDCVSCSHAVSSSVSQDQVPCGSSPGSGLSQPPIPGKLWRSLHRPDADGMHCRGCRTEHHCRHIQPEPSARRDSRCRCVRCQCIGLGGE